MSGVIADVLPGITSTFEAERMQKGEETHPFCQDRKIFPEIFIAYFPLGLIGQNWVTWPPLPAKEVGCWGIGLS